MYYNTFNNPYMNSFMNGGRLYGDVAKYGRTHSNVAAPLFSYDAARATRIHNPILPNIPGIKTGDSRDFKMGGFMTRPVGMSREGSMKSHSHFNNSGYGGTTTPGYSSQYPKFSSYAGLRGVGFASGVSGYGRSTNATPTMKSGAHTGNFSNSLFSYKNGGNLSGSVNNIPQGGMGYMPMNDFRRRIHGGMLNQYQGGGMLDAMAQAAASKMGSARNEGQRNKEILAQAGYNPVQTSANGSTKYAKGNRQSITDKSQPRYKANPNHKGSRKQYQQMLTDLGYDTGGVDGIFGRKTGEAVKAFQRASGLKADGILGKNTIAALNKVRGGNNTGKYSVSDKRKSTKDLKPVYRDRQPKMPEYTSDAKNPLKRYMSSKNMYVAPSALDNIINSAEGYLSKSFMKSDNPILNKMFNVFNNTNEETTRYLHDELPDFQQGGQMGQSPVDMMGDPSNQHMQQLLAGDPSGQQGNPMQQGQPQGQPQRQPDINQVAQAAMQGDQQALQMLMQMAQQGDQQAMQILQQIEQQMQGGQQGASQGMPPEMMQQMQGQPQGPPQMMYGGPLKKKAKKKPSYKKGGNMTYKPKGSKYSINLGTNGFIPKPVR